MIIKSFIKNITPPVVYKLLKHFFGGNVKICSQLFQNDIIKSYSQFQEDLIIDSILSNKVNGFYIDIGAFDPTDISNTKKFYDKGWTGINVDPIKSVVDKFKIARPNDINLHAGVSHTEGEYKFYEFKEQYLSTFSEEKLISIKQKFPKATLVGSYYVKTLPLKRLMTMVKCPVDFLSIDVEGYELNILNSNDWQSYRPKLILIEILQNMKEIFQYLETENYKCVFSNNYNAIFLDTLLLK